jgi:hypothetical protein
MEKRTRTLTTILVIALLFFVTELFGAPMLQKARKSQDPVVLPILPFVLMGHDRTGLVGETTLYIWYGTGVAQVWRSLIWIV